MKRLVLVYSTAARHNQNTTLSTSLTRKLKVGLPTLARVSIDLFTSVYALTDWTRQEKQTIETTHLLSTLLIKIIKFSFFEAHMLQKNLPYNINYRIINLIYNMVYYFITFILVSTLTARKH